MPVTARRLVRKMRGGAQAHLIEADDGHFYVVKFVNNPQHRRILINESLAASFLTYLQLSTPPTAIVEIDQAFLDTNPDAGLQLGTRRLSIEPGWHFGSRFPGDPERQAVYDFVPDALLAKVENRREFLGMPVFDKWLGNADARQSVFLRARLRDWVAARDAHPLRVGFMTLMIDHGYVFNGPHWEFIDTPLQGLYFRPAVYQGASTWADFEPWLARVEQFPDTVIDQALKQIPRQWLDTGEEDQLEHLMERLLRRRSRVRDLVRDCTAKRPNVFPAWSGN